MNSWPTKKLTDLLESCDAGVWGKPAIKGKGLFVLRSTNMTNDGKLDFLDVAERDIKGDINKLKLLNGDILIEKSGGGPDQPVGRVAYFTAPDDNVYTFANFIQRIRVKFDLMDSRFLFYRLFFLHKIGFTKKLQSQTTGIRNLKLSLYLKTEIPLPPLKIQKQIVERLDKIAEAQKLNDELIQKTDELFQSLLHKELNSTGKNWKEDKFVNCIEKNPLKIKGIPREKYQSIGKFPIIDQSDKFIIGYTDNEDKVYKIDSPVIIFGDHTRIFKYIDFNFAIGADGTQIIIPDRKIIIPKFFYFLMLNLKINNLGYSRHFKILKTKKIINPPIKIQKQIVAKLSAVQDYKKQLLAQKSKLKELFDSVLAKSMKS